MVIIFENCQTLDKLVHTIRNGSIELVILADSARSQPFRFFLDLAAQSKEAEPECLGPTEAIEELRNRKVNVEFRCV